MILGHTRQIEYLKKILAKKRLPHALFFHGPEHIGKFTVARKLAFSLLCTGGQDFGGCGTCDSCRKVGAGTHESLWVIDREHTLTSKKEVRKDIPIDDIRELKRIFSFAPIAEQWRIVIINDAEFLSQEAANSFLKLLEEPGDSALFILIASSYDGVLPTIASRAQAMSFSLVHTDDLARALHKKNYQPQNLEEVLAIAQGRPGVAVHLLESKDAFEEERRFMKSFYYAAKAGLPEGIRFSQMSAEEPETTFKLSEYMVRLIRKKLLETQDAGMVASVKRMLDIASALTSTNVNPRLALDAMFLEWYHPSAVPNART